MPTTDCVSHWIERCSLSLSLNKRHETNKLKKKKINMLIIVIRSFVLVLLLLSLFEFTDLVLIKNIMNVDIVNLLIIYFDILRLNTFGRFGCHALGTLVRTPRHFAETT